MLAEAKPSSYCLFASACLGVSPTAKCSLLLAKHEWIRLENSLDLRSVLNNNI